MIGLVFARSTTDPNVGYALAMGQVMSDVRRAEQQNAAVGTGNCAA